MNITKIIIYIFIFLPISAFAGKGPTQFHKFQLDADIGKVKDGTIYSWDFYGWIGSDENKLWLKSEGSKLESAIAEQAEFWAMYSRNISTFWDGQVGIRFDEQPKSTIYLVAGLEGLAPYFFETEAHLFISEYGDITARLKQENELLITQKLIMHPYFEINFSAQDIPDKEIGLGLTDLEIGIQTKYEIHRKFTPYIDISYERKLGETSQIAKNDGKNTDDFVIKTGISLMF